MRSYAENVFYHLSDRMYAEDVSGESDAPTGYFGLVEVPSDPAERAQMFREAETYMYHDKIQRHSVEPGWYIVSVNSGGYLAVEPFDSEDKARMVYKAMDDEYTLWCAQDPDSDIDTDEIHTWFRRAHDDQIYCTSCGMEPTSPDQMDEYCPGETYPSK